MVSESVGLISESAVSVSDSTVLVSESWLVSDCESRLVSDSAVLATDSVVLVTDFSADRGSLAHPAWHAGVRAREHDFAQLVLNSSPFVLRQVLNSVFFFETSKILQTAEDYKRFGVAGIAGATGTGAVAW